MAKLLPLSFLLCTCVCATLAYNDSPEALMTEAFAKLLRGAPDQRIESIDPLYISFFEGNFATLHYKNYNNTVRGLGNCTMTKVVFSSDRRMVYFVLDCPSYVLSSSNEVEGYLMYESMYGRGTMEIYYGRYVVSVYAQIFYVKDYQGKVFYNIGLFSLDISVRSRTKYNFMHLYKNNKYESDAINKFANNNWEACAVFSKEPVWYAIMKEIVIKLNKCLLAVAIE